MTPIVEIIGNVIQAVRLSYDPNNLRLPYYLYGHPQEIVDILGEMDGDSVLKYEKFPLVILVQDFEEEMGFEGYDSETSLNIIIATETDANLRSADRRAVTFTPILYPIYNLLIEKLKESTELDANKPVHTKIERPYYGRSGLYGNEGNIFNDFIDAIELQNLELKILKIC
jgi:hypothetical protein